MNFIVFKLVDPAKHSTIEAKPVRLNLSILSVQWACALPSSIGLERMMC